ncbi:MAG: glycosyltransferase [Archangium sp.]|nr:glycosyltransferase [Archangium sp.]
MNRTGLLYLTADGLLQPLGFSQVVRVVEGLARRGWEYDIFSLERGSDLRDERRVRELRLRLDAAGIGWRFAEYGEGGGGRTAFDNEQRLVSAAVDFKGRGIHARAYHSAVAALAAWVARRTPYLFDTRCYWFDERLEDGRWFTTPVRLGVARGIEHHLFSRAAGVVTLTELQADDVRGGRFGKPTQRSILCIPTCADFDDFRRRPLSEVALPAEAKERLSGKRVIALIGSINRSYLVDESIDLVKRFLRLDARAHLLVLSAQQDEYRTRLKGVEAERFTITRANHDAMPQWLSLIEWGPLLLNPSSPAKRASMPTKLAEYFASGVRPIQFGCNSELGDWVRRTGSGVALNDVTAETLESTAQWMANTPSEEALRERARVTAEQHFSLATGIERYEQVLRATFAP